ncbi:MAG: dihydrolipoyl dehydrogenase [Gammaproteobacteria bacterium]|nr:dihydrolipoyl dehydrogenase [Gammaproteobacteria bacterium]NIM74957.1 dihydrolipoyl dehydrogenase [Gammaproteobacteria bacterium]NIN39746.1 dihydrolipoyl dehydrogenase [Gammaproteobacteria bacterium]NIO26874.1 dihydrolipoyl dehydrogenase [Gammaproteobacteria bacterium]NIO67430.1 dihydrolipoyl dehydrogenase [Gammaproteobacteria bacterium]
MPRDSEVKVPDIGDFEGVEIIEVAVAPGDRVEVEQPLITLESDKATMDVPSPLAGVVKSMAVSVGDQVSEGTLILVLETADEAAAGESAPAAPGPESTEDTRQAPAPPAAAAGEADVHAQVVVIGAGPGGYTAAFRAADLGQKTVLVERYATLGGVCLNVGCIPSKALLHTAEVINAAAAMAAHGVEFGKPKITLAKLAAWKDSVVAQLTKGLAGLAKQRKVEVLQGVAKFLSPNLLEVSGADGVVRVAFDSAIIAAGSQATEIGSFPNDDPRLMDSTDALLLEDIPKRLLVIGGGIIGLEMATVYQSLGSSVSVVELLDGLMPGCDRDLVRPLQKRIEKLYEAIYLGTRVTGIEAQKKALKVHFEGAKAPASDAFDRVLVAVGRRPNGKRIGADAAGVVVDDAGFIPVDSQQRTNVPHIFAIGDITGQPMLAHKATHEGKVAAQVASGEKSRFDALAIPSVAYTDPEVAWTGVTETQAKERGIEFDKATFPWAASGRSLGMGRNEGLTKLLFEKSSGRLIGAGIVGPHAGDLIAEATLALEMGADAADLALTIHPHPTLSETVNFAAEMVEGTITDLYVPKRK